MDGSIDETSNRLFFRLFQASNTLQTQATRALDEFGVTAAQWSVLGALSRPAVTDGMSMSELGDYLRVSRQNLTGVLARLERRGVVERTTAAHDGRSRTVRLTADGRALWAELAGPISAFYERALRDLSERQRAAFIDSLTKIQQRMAED